MTEKYPVGRRTILTPELQENIIQALRGGNYLDDAARYAGVAERTVYQWIQKGRQAREALEEGVEPTANELLYIQFAQAVEKARSDAVVRNLTIIQKAANDGQWQAAAWYLERTNPKKWGRYETVEVTGEGTTVSVEISAKDALYQKLAAMEERAIQAIEVQSRELPPEVS